MNQLNLYKKLMSASKNGAVVLLIATIAPAWADKAEIQKTIQSQINAFQEDDFEVALLLYIF